MKNLNLVRNMAWTFSKKSNIDYKELFSEAALAYCEAVESFDPDKNAKLSTWAWWCMKNHLINFCKKEQNTNEKVSNMDLLDIAGDEDPKSASSYEISTHALWRQIGFYDNPSEEVFEERMEDWPEDCKTTIEMVLNAPEKFLGQTPNYSRNGSTPLQRVKNSLRNKGWTHKRVQSTVNQMHEITNSL